MIYHTVVDLDRVSDSIVAQGVLPLGFFAQPLFRRRLPGGQQNEPVHVKRQIPQADFGIGSHQPDGSYDQLTSSVGLHAKNKIQLPSSSVGKKTT